MQSPLTNFPGFRRRAARFHGVVQRQQAQTLADVPYSTCPLIGALVDIAADVRREPGFSMDDASSLRPAYAALAAGTLTISRRVLASRLKAVRQFLDAELELFETHAPLKSPGWSRERRDENNYIDRLRGRWADAYGAREALEIAHKQFRTGPIPMRGPWRETTR